MIELNLPKFDYKLTKSSNGDILIFDIIRKRKVILTPEEWVRQHIVNFLVTHKKYPQSLVALEREINVYNTKKRFDILCFDRYGEAFLIVECKAPKVKITEQVLEQALRYNTNTKAPYILLTNGIYHYVFNKKNNGDFSQLELIPDFPQK